MRNFNKLDSLIDQVLSLREIIHLDPHQQSSLPYTKLSSNQKGRLQIHAFS